MRGCAVRRLPCHPGVCVCVCLKRNSARTTAALTSDHRQGHDQQRGGGVDPVHTEAERKPGVVFLYAVSVVVPIG